MPLLQLSKRRALRRLIEGFDRMNMAEDERSRWRITIQHPELSGTYVRDSRSPAVSHAVWEVAEHFEIDHRELSANDARVVAEPVHR